MPKPMKDPKTLCITVYKRDAMIVTSLNTFQTFEKIVSDPIVLKVVIGKPGAQKAKKRELNLGGTR